MFFVFVFVYVFVHAFPQQRSFGVQFPTSEAWGFQSLNKTLSSQFQPETTPSVNLDSYSDSYGVKKLLDGKRRFRKPDYHNTKAFWPQAHFRYTATCCVYVYVTVDVDVSVFAYVSV